MNAQTYSMHETLRFLMELKSKRDNKKFTVYQLAKALNMPHSMIIKLIHQDPDKRVHNPRIETLSKIVDYFKKEGFNVSIDDIISGNVCRNTVEVSNHFTEAPQITNTLNVYSMQSDHSASLGQIDINLDFKSKSLIALVSDADIKPIFKKGSLFIVDTKEKIKDKNLVVVKDTRKNRTLVRKAHIEKQKTFLYSFEPKKHRIELDHKNGYKLIGTVIQVDAKT